MILLRVPIFLLGITLIIWSLYSAVQTLVLPRSTQDKLTRILFDVILAIFSIGLRRFHTYTQRDRLMAFYAPVCLLSLVPAWLSLLLLGYTGVFWSLGEHSWLESFRVSGSSLLTLGFAVSKSFTSNLLEFSEAALGLMMVALLIAYLPTMYAAFSRREAAVTMLDVRAGSPPSAIQMLARYHRIHGLDQLKEQWQLWEAWFADIEESHTSLPGLIFFRSPKPDHSWVTAAGAILDTASLTLSAVDIPASPHAALCIRAGFLALRHIGDFANIPYPPDPHYPDQDICITRQEFDQACDELKAQNIPIKPDREQAWQDFAGWRVNYDQVLLELVELTMAPASPWSGNRSEEIMYPFNFHSI
jgi:hypothetical protein